MKAIAALLAAAFSVALSYGVTLPALPDIVQRVVSSGDASTVVQHAGWLTSVYTVALLLFAPVWGALSDRVDRRVVAGIGLAGTAAGLLQIDAATSLPALYVLRAFSGAIGAAVLPPVLAHVAAQASSEERPKRFAAIATATTLGFLLGPPIGSLVAFPFRLAALANLIACAALAFVPRADSGGKSSVGEYSLDAAALRRALLLTAAVVFGITAAEVGITLLPKRADGAVDPSHLFVVCGLSMIAVQTWLYPRLLRVLAEGQLVAGAFGAAAGGLVLMALGSGHTLLVTAFALSGSGIGIAIPALALRVSRTAGGRQGQAMGWQAAAANLGQAAAAAVTGSLVTIALPAPFLLAAVVLAIGTVCSLPSRTRAVSTRRA